MFQQIRFTIANIIAPELKTRRNDLERSANTDALTGLGNMRAFQKAAPAAAADPNLSFLSIDLNSFKAVNDQLGHQAGDDVLIEFADYLTIHAELLGSTRIFRTGGDEFAVIIENALAQELCEYVEKTSIQAKHLTVTASASWGSNFKVADLGLPARKKITKTKGVTV